MKARNILFTMALLGIAIVTSNAQNSFGFRIGTNTSSVPVNLDFANGNFLKNQTGVSVAFIGEFGITDQLFFQPEIALTPKGFKIKEGISVEGIPLGIENVTKVQYLDVPLLAKYQFGTGKIKTYVTAGPVLSYALSGRNITRAKVFIDIPLNNSKLNLDNIGYERFEIAGTVGAGVVLDSGSGKLFADARFTRGFKDIYNIPIVDVPLKNQSMAVNVGYMFSF